MYLGKNRRNALAEWHKGHGNMSMFSSAENLALQATRYCPEFRDKFPEFVDGVNYTVEEFEDEFACGLDEFDKLFVASKDITAVLDSLDKTNANMAGLKCELAQRTFYSLCRDIERGRGTIGTRVGALDILVEDANQTITLDSRIYLDNAHLFTPFRPNSFNFNHDVASWRVGVKRAFTPRSPEYCRRVALNFVEEFLKSIQSVKDAESFGATLGRIPAPAQFIRVYTRTPDNKAFHYALDMIREAGRSELLARTKIACLLIYVTEYLLCETLADFRKVFKHSITEVIGTRSGLFTKVDNPDFLGIPAHYTFSQAPWWDFYDYFAWDMTDPVWALLTYILDDGYPMIGQPRVPGSKYYTNQVAAVRASVEAYQEGLLLGLNHGDPYGTFCGFRLKWDAIKPTALAYASAMIRGDFVRRPNKDDLEVLRRDVWNGEYGPEVKLYAEE